MTALTLDALQHDQLVMSVARALALANEVALNQGINPNSSLVTISEESSATGRLWKIHYGPKNYIGRRGGDLTVQVDEATGTVQRILRGQ